MKNKDQIQNEALEAIGDLKEAGVEISMGVGKTLLGLKHMTRNYTDVSKFLVVAPKLSIFLSWKENMKEFDLEYLEDHITFCTYRSLSKEDFDYDVVYLDECHSLKNTYKPWLKHIKAKGATIIGLTGTYPNKTYTEKGEMCNEFCPKVYVYNTDDAIDDNILNDYKIYVHMLELDRNKTVPKKGKYGEFKTSEVSDYSYWTERLLKAEMSNNKKGEQICRIQRMKALQSFITKERYAKKLLDNSTDKTIVFASYKNQADFLCSNSYHSSNIHSEENLHMFKNGDITKLSAVEQLSEGVNIPNLKVGIIMHAYANNRKTAQKLGRLLRLNPDDEATIHVLCYKDTIDELWVKSSLASFDENKITYI